MPQKLLPITVLAGSDDLQKETSLSPPVATWPHRCKVPVTQAEEKLSVTSQPTMRG